MQKSGELLTQIAERERVRMLERKREREKEREREREGCCCFVLLGKSIEERAIYSREFLLSSVSAPAYEKENSR